MTTLKKSHAQWGSKFGFILAATGSAIGLGNIWKFPYMTGMSGGSAFVLTYLCCIALVGFPILVAEWLIGRRGQKNPIYTMEEVARQNNLSRNWRWIGVLGVAGAFLILSFYSIIGGWALNYITLAGSQTFLGIQADGASAIFTNLLADPWRLLMWYTIFMIIIIAIVSMGVSKGLELGSKIMMPALAVVLIILVAYGAFATGHFGEAVTFLFKPNWNLITGEVILAALGHAFFTLSLGMGIMMAYGSYLGKEINLLKTARTVVILDTVFALIAGLAIFPLVFANQLEPTSGPGLIFISLPIAFGNMPGGLILGTLFFILLTFAAVTSAMSLLEPCVELVEEKIGLSRKKSTIVVGALVWLLGIASLLSFNVWSDVKLFDLGIFDFLDFLTSKLTLPLTGLATIIFLGWMMNKHSVLDELHLSGLKATIWIVVTRFVAPLAVIAIFITSLF